MRHSNKRRSKLLGKGYKPRDQLFGKGFIVFPFSKNMNQNSSRYINRAKGYIKSKNFDHTGNSATDANKTA